MYQINVFDRKYENYQITSFLNEEKLLNLCTIKSSTNGRFTSDKGNCYHALEMCEGVNINPITHKLFHNDIFNLDESKKPVIISSPMREKSYFAGILVLNGNKSYGRKNNSNKKDKLLYKCIPNDYFLPSFLIPYEMKSIGFSKLFHNLYITFKFDHWEEKHPHGILLQNIGTVNELPNFYEYQLYCKYLHDSIHKFEKETAQSIKKITNQKDNEFFEFIQKKYNGVIEDRTSHFNVFTIDPEGSIDFDDAFSIKTMIHNEFVNKTSVLLSIYISNVPIVLDALQLWSFFGSRISTIYLPDKKRSMLPSLLGDHLCSLIEKVVRVAFTMDIILECDEFENIPIKIKRIEFKNTLIKVEQNFVYEDPKLLNNLNYKILFDVVKRLSNDQSPKYNNNINDSHDVITYLMIWMNHECSKKLLEFNNGIFRKSHLNEQMKSEFLKVKNSSSMMEVFHNQIGKYVDKSQIDNKDDLIHNVLKLDSYVHITSPIRRLVDLLNMIQIQQNLNIIELSNDCHLFYKKCINRLEFINDNMNHIKKIQNQCCLLEKCTNHPDILEKKWEGIIVDSKDLDFQRKSYDIYLIDLKFFGKIISTYPLCLDSINYFKINIFNDEETFKKKVRLNLI